ncbi:MAG: TetR/AcrR family transcriptional regulator [Terriglobus sp.]
MVKNAQADDKTSKAEATRALILEAALDQFREKGFDAATMQGIADHAGVAKSAAYYYFPAKEAIINAYYDSIQSQSEVICAEAYAAMPKLRDRLGVAMMTKLDLAKRDRRLLGIVFRYTGEPEHPLSCLGKEQSAMRVRAVAVFRDALRGEKLPADLDELLPVSLWSLQMGLLILFLYDNSPNQRRTRRLADGALDLTMKLLLLAKLPVLRPVRTRVLSLLREAELL